MTCSQCWSAVPAKQTVCPRCGAKVTGAPPSFLGLVKSYPWLVVVLALSAMVTLWAATRRAPSPPPPIPPAVEPVAAPSTEPVFTPGPELVPVPMPVAEPEPVAEAAAPEPVKNAGNKSPPPPPPSSSAYLQPDGTWRSSPPSGL